MIKLLHIPDRGLPDYKPHGRHKWLQRLCIWILVKLEAQKVKEVAIDLQKLDEQIMANYHLVLQLMRERPTKIYVGRDVFSKMLIERERHSPKLLQFHVSEPFDYVSYRGMTVIVVPYLKGFFCAPSDENI